MDVPVRYHRARLPGVRIERQLAATDFGVREESLQHVEGVGVEVRRIMFERHGQHRIDAETEVERGLRDEQVGTRGHTGHDPQLGVWKMLGELPQDRRDSCTQVRQRVRPQITVPGDPNDEWRDGAVLAVIRQNLGRRWELRWWLRQALCRLRARWDNGGIHGCRKSRAICGRLR